MANIVLLQDPKFGIDYKAGHVFFSYSSSFVSRGIALFSNFENYSNVPVSHCGIITGSRTCLEASVGGVQESDFITKYVQDPHTLVFLRSPIGLTPAKAIDMEMWATQHIGKNYAYVGIAGSALWNMLGLVFLRWLRKQQNPFNPKDEYFCSELVAEAMIKAWPNRPGCLQYHPSNIYPQTLFEDRKIFKDWKTDIVQVKLIEGAKIITP